MEENKYYTPEINEFFVGFEYESSNLSNKNPWNKKVASVIDIYEVEACLRLYPEGIRVKFLDKEDIEAEGWKFKDDVKVPFEKNLFLETRFTKGEWRLDYTRNIFEKEAGRWVLIYQINTESKMGEVVPNIKTLFNGKINNRSELRRILKMINLV